MDKTLSDAVLVANEAGLTDRDLAAVVEAAMVARRREAAWPGEVLMVHPNGSRATTTLEAFEVHKLSGWQLVPPPDPEPVEDETEPKPAKAAKAPAKKETPKPAKAAKAPAKKETPA